MDLLNGRGAAYGLHVVCYDIASKRRRRAVVKILEGYGVRAQESVFECWMNAGQRRILEAKLEDVLCAAEDRIACYAVDTQAARVLCFADHPPQDFGTVLV